MRNLILPLLWTIFHAAYGQDTVKTRHFGIDYSIERNYFARWNSLPSITYSTSKHSIFAGPIIVNLNSLNEGYYENFYPSLAIQTGYQIYPNGRKKRFNLFFEYNFIYLKTKTNTYNYDPNPTQTWGGVKTRTSYIFSQENYFCYGVRLNITHGLYLKTNVGTGFGWYRHGGTFKYWDGHFAGGYPTYSWTFENIFKIGLGCDFSILKKK